MKRNIALLVMAIAVGTATTVHARSVTARSVDNFYQLVSGSKFPFSVLFLYDQSQASCNDKRALKELLRSLRGMSRSDFYCQGGLQFVSANAAKSDLDDLVQELGVGSMPVFVLFKNGMPLKDNETQQIATLYGMANTPKLRAFINDNLQDELQELVSDKAEERRIRAAELNYYWGCGWGWGCYPGWGGCGWGNGCGWGGGYGGWGCGRGYGSVSFGVGGCF